MANVQIVEFETNKVIKDSVKLSHIPNVGEYVILDNFVEEGWKEKFFIVRAVTHLLSDLVIIHISKFDWDEEERLKQMHDKLKEKLNKGGWHIETDCD